MSNSDSPAIQSPFTFSQSSLEDFERCRRRFFLRYVEGLEWPARAASGPFEASLRQRQRFHRLLRQHFIGVDVEEVIQAEPPGSTIRAWWEAFRRYPPALPAGEKYPEVLLSTPMGEHRLAARFDLLAVGDDGRGRIVDWKTGRPPSRSDELAESWQSVVYLYVLAVAGAPYFGGLPPAPAAIDMLYWLAELPASPILAPYSSEAHARAGRRLSEQIATIAGLPASAFEPCEDQSTCAYCEYQGYCRRGTALLEPDQELELEYEDEEWYWADAPEYEC